MGTILREAESTTRVKFSGPASRYICKWFNNYRARAGARINAAAATGRYIILMKHEHVYINHTLPFLFSTAPLMAARALRLAHGGRPRAED